MSPEIIALVGGSALLVHAMTGLSDTVQYLAGSRLRIWVNTFADNRVSGILLGIFFSLLLSSSGAVTVMLVGLANARLLSLEQVFCVILGASVGTTFIIQLIAFRISEYGLIMIALGVGTSSFAKADRSMHLGRGLMFLGMLFFSMKLIQDAGAQLEQNDLFQYTINYFKDRPIISLILATLLTAVIHSSAATIGFVMSLMIAKNGTVYEALPWILGANLGTTTTAYFASYRGGVYGKQAALGHLLCKIVGVLICFPLISHLGFLSQSLSTDLSRQIAHGHTLFNLFILVLFFPFITQGVRFVRKMIPDNKPTGPFNFQYLDARSLQTPEFALAQAHREILRLTDAVEQMVERCIGLFSSGDATEIESIRSTDQVVDFLNKGIKLYLTKLSQKEMTPEQVQKEFELLLRTNDLENIGDIVDKNIISLVKKNFKKGYSFSKEGWSDIIGFHAKVVECLRLSTAYFTSRDRALSAKLKLIHQEIEDLTIELSEQHVQRLHRGVKETLNTTSVHLDLLGYLQRIATLSINFTRVLTVRQDEFREQL